MQLSKELQDLANAAITEEVEVSQSEKDALYRLIMQKKNTVTKDKKAATVAEIHNKKIKPVYMIAACVAIIALIGAGYSASIYFNKIYQRGENTTAGYDVITDNPELLVEPPAASTDIPVVELDKMGRLHLGTVFSGKTPGELFDVEIHTSDKKAFAQGLKGNGLNLISMVTDDGVPGMESIVINDQSPSTQTLINRMIAKGSFMVTVNHPSFTPIEYWTNSIYQSLHYSDGKDTVIGLTFDPHFSGSGVMPQSVYDNANPEDLTINGNHFVLMRVGDSYLADLYLGDHSSLITNTVSISFGSISKDRNKVVEILNTVQIHNKDANKLVIADEVFFADFPQPAIKDNAEQIANAIRTASSHENMPVWEQGALSVDSGQDGWSFAITTKEGFDKDSTFYPYGGQHTTITTQSWFNKEKFSTLSVAYKGVNIASAMYSSDDRKYTLITTILDNGYAQSPLDAIIAEAGNGGQYLKVDNLVNPNSDNPLVVMSDLNDNIAVFSARKIEGGKFLVQKLSMARADLPKELS